MKIDVVIPTQLKRLEDTLRTVSTTQHEEIKYLKSLVMQLQDRIKILEDRR